MGVPRPPFHTPVVLIHFFRVQVGLSRMEGYWLTGNGLFRFLNVHVTEEKGFELKTLHCVILNYFLWPQSTFPFKVFFAWILVLMLNFFPLKLCVRPRSGLWPSRHFFPVPENTHSPSNHPTIPHMPPNGLSMWKSKDSGSPGEEALQ